MAASASSLGELHKALTFELMEQLKPREEPILNKDGEEVGTRTVRASPAVLGAITAFLKNNNITADPEQNEALRDLTEKLAQRRMRKIPQAALDDAAEQYTQRFGMSLQ